MSKGGVLNIVPKSVGNAPLPKIPNTPISNILQRVLFIGIALTFVYMLMGIKAESSLLDLSSMGQTIVNIIPVTLTIIKEYIIYPTWSVITYPLTWCFGLLPDVDIPDSKMKAPDISLGLNDIFPWQDKDLNELNDKSADIKNAPSYQTSETDNDVIKPNTHTKKTAYQYSRKKAFLKYKSIGEASITPQDIAIAQIQGREEVLKQHKLRGALSITPEEISEAFNSGKKDILQSYKLKSLQSVDSEGSSNALNSNKEQRKTKESEAQESIHTSIQIALLRTFSNQTEDPYIVAKIMFMTKLNQCLKQSPQDPAYLDNSIKSVNITSSENVLSDNTFEHVILGQKLLKEMPEDIPYKKWFCDLISECQNNHNISHCLERTQKITGP